MMKQYDSYKDSGVEWIGKIPSHWEVCAFKRKIVINNGRDYKEYLDDELYPVMGSGGCFAYCSKYLYDGEAVLLGRKGTIDKPLYINGKFWAVDTMFYATPLKSLHCKFAYYLALTFPFNYYSTSTALPSMTQSDLGNNPVAIPPYVEQEIIALYLDKKCGEIDKAVATQEKRVDLLKELRQNIITQAVTRGINPNAPLKDSGVKWIGMIPSHWDVVPLKRKMQIIRGGSPRPIEQYLSDEGYNWIKIGDTVKGDKYIRNTSQKIKREGLSATRLVHRGDLILSNSMSFGEPYIIDFEEGCIHDGWLSLSHLNNVDKEFLYYTLLSELCKKQFESFVDGGVVKNLNIDKAGYAIIFIPPLSEQQEIVSYIETQTARLDKSIEKAEHQIELLQELKQSIITEVVTGKRKVD